MSDVGLIVATIEGFMILPLKKKLLIIGLLARLPHLGPFQNFQEQKKTRRY